MKYILLPFSRRHRGLFILVISISFLSFVCPALAQQVEGDERWSSEFGEHIAFNAALEVVVTSGEHIYAVGTFTRVGGQFAEGMARWDGERWQAMTGGVCPLDDLMRRESSCFFRPGSAVARGDSVYAAAGYRLPGSDASKWGLLLWDGAEWSEVLEWSQNAFSSGVHDMVFIGNDLFIAGSFDFIQEGREVDRVNGVIKWDGQTWELIGDLGVSFTTRVRWLAPTEDYLYIAGSFFDTVNGVDVSNNIARWDGQTWEEVGPYVGVNLLNMQVIDGEIYLMGGLSDGEGTTRPLSLAIWDGLNWDRFEDPGITGTPFSAVKIDDTLYLEGNFSSEGLEPNGQTFFKVIKRENGKWSPVKGLSADAQQYTEGITRWNDELVIFSERNVEILGEGGIRPLDNPNNGLNGSVWDMEAHNGRLFVAGDFSAAGGQPSHGMAEWDGVQWVPYGATFDGWISHLAVAANGTMYATGLRSLHPYATQVNGQPLDAIAVFDGNQWEALPGRFRISDSDTTGSARIYSLEVFDNNLYVSGNFQWIDEIEAPGIAMWDGDQWMPLSTNYNFDLRVRSMAYVDGSLYVGGAFENGDNAPGYVIAKWDGSTWSAVGNDDFPSWSILDMKFENGSLYVAASDSLYQWDGSTWSALARRGGEVTSFQLQDSTLYVGTEVVVTSDMLNIAEHCMYPFSSVVGIENGFVRPLGSSTWFCKDPDFPLSWGTRSEVRAMEIMNGKLYIGGDFNYAGGKPSNYIGEWSLSPVRVSTNKELPAHLDVQFGQPYPNPFTQSVRAAFNLSGSSAVKVEVYNLLGQRIALLMDETRPAGNHEITWIPGGLHAGLYFLVLQTQEKRRMQKVIYVK